MQDYIIFVWEQLILLSIFTFFSFDVIVDISIEKVLKNFIEEMKERDAQRDPQHYTHVCSTQCRLYNLIEKIS